MPLHSLLHLIMANTILFVYCIFCVLSLEFYTHMLCGSSIFLLASMQIKMQENLFCPSSSVASTKATVNDKQDSRCCTFTKQKCSAEHMTHFNREYLVHLALVHLAGRCARRHLLIHHLQIGNMTSSAVQCMLKAVTRVTYYLVKVPQMVTRKWREYWQHSD